MAEAATPPVAPPVGTPPAPPAGTPPAAATPPAQSAPATTTPGTTTPPAQPAPTKDATGAPERYSAFTVPKDLPEGYQLAKPVVDSVEKVARELGLPQDRAQKLIDTLLPTTHRMGQEHLAAMVSDWESQIANHKELGGAKLDESRATVRQAVEKLDPSGALQQFLESPFQPGKHPALFAALHKVGQLMQPDGFVASRRGPSSGADQSPDDSTLAAKLYPKSAAAV